MAPLVNGAKTVQDFLLILKVILKVGMRCMIHRLVAQRLPIRMVQLLPGVKMVPVGMKTLLVRGHKPVSIKKQDVA